MFAKSGKPEEKGKVLMEGNLRKLKTMKKKYFVLRAECADVAASLEYYDTEKKYRAGHQPKRTIFLKLCFNINRKMDTKQKHVIALYTKDDVFCIVLDDEKQMEEWLRLLLLLQSGGDDVVDGSPPKPNFDYTWRVNVQDKGLGLSHKLNGQYYVALSDTKLCLIKVADTSEQVDFPLTFIRSSGNMESFFYMEVGRQSKTGAGELWMATDDPNIARNMNEVIQTAFTRQRDSDPYRKRSCSATEMNRPLQRRYTQGSGKPLLVTPYSGYSWNAAQPAPPLVSISPPIDVYQNVAPGSSYSSRYLSAGPRPPSLRRHSVSAVSSCTASAAALARAAAAADAAVVVSHQRTKSCPVSDMSLPLTVEQHRVLSQSHVTLGEGDRRGSGAAHRRHGSVKCTSGPRERCDSMPSRNRTTSEGTHKGRPTSVHMRVSYSPPGLCSTDSAGSSLSIDETDHMATPEDNTILEENADDALQWPADPDLEAEKLDTMSLDYERPPASLSLPIGPGRKVSLPGILHGSSCGSSPAHGPDYMTMSPSDAPRRPRPGSSPSASSDYLPMSPGDVARRIVGSPSSNSDYLPFSPASSHQPGTMTSSPSNHSDYLAMSPATRVSNTASMDYLPMSPGEGSVPSSRAKRNKEDDGYVPMAPAHSDDGYVDMDPQPLAHRFLNDDHHSDMSPSSSCSVTSGTPSSDHYLLEKVSACLTHSEEEDDGRPARTYSFGSQPQRRLDSAKALESARQRAFSMGNQMRPPHKLATRPVNHVKFSSAPLLSNSWSGSSRVPPNPMAHLMELDFTDKSSRSTSRIRHLPVTENLVTNNNSSADSGYMDMSSKSPPRASPPKLPSTKHLFSPPDGKASLGRKPPHIISSTTLKTIGEKPDIKPQKFPTSSSAHSSELASRTLERPYVEMKGRTLSGSSVDGYMEMTPGSNKTVRKTSVDTVSSYMQMQPGRKMSEGNPAPDYMPMSCTKRSSQPIAIVGPSSPTMRTNSFTSPPQPPSFLPLNSSGSSGLLSGRRRKSRKKTERRDSKENMTTPTGIFPLSLNSPQSPKKGQSVAEPASSSVEAAGTPLSRVLRLSEKANAATADEPDYAVMLPGSLTLEPPGSEASGRSRPSEQDGPVRLMSQGSTSSEGTCESCRLKTAAGEPHSGVTRQVSTSSSSSTEVMSVKDGNEKDITYATLEMEGEEPRSPRPSPAPSPAPAAPTSAYAEIDFRESLRAPAHSLRKIRH